MSEYNLLWKHRKSYFDELSDTSRLGIYNVEGKAVLDVGCGVGRDMKSFKDAKLLVGIDTSDSINIAKENLKENNIEFYKVNLFDFNPKEKFDVVYSNGVLHHTPNAREAFRKVASFVKEGGSLSIFLYHKHYPLNQKIAFWRKYLTRLNPKLLLAFCFMIPFIPFIPHQESNWNGKLSFKNQCIGNYDWYAPKYRSLHTYPEVYGWFKEAGFKEIELFDPPVSMKGIKCNTQEI